MKEANPGVLAPAGLLLGAILALSSGSVRAEEPPPLPFLRKVIQLDDAQLALLEKGEVVTKLLPTKDKPEIAAFGVVKTKGTPDLLLKRARDIRRFRQVPQIPEMGVFSSPPRLEDMKGHQPSSCRHRRPQEVQARELRRQAG